ncbi:MAG: cyclodeaminase/cyclohydrolase family protein [Clostridiales bacterium]|nr:cyclodeaminase/cyclohydrolase family protein [Clostridiales bacterium]HBM81450.1 hypothetical protein [Clostridiaceae bacterium]
MLLDISLRDYLRRASQSNAAPGGGSVCALSAALGAAMNSMVGEISISKCENNDGKDKMESMVNASIKLMDELKCGIDEDVEAFNMVLEAYRLPKDTADEKRERSGAIQDALKGASALPLRIAYLSVDVMKMSINMLEQGRKSALSDASCGGFLGYAALNGALCNVRINIKSIDDKNYAADMEKRVEYLENESENLLAKIKELSLKKLAKM